MLHYNLLVLYYNRFNTKEGSNEELMTKKDLSYIKEMAKWQFFLTSNYIEYKCIKSSN